MSTFASRTSRGGSTHRRKYTISTHALERFRERVDDEFRYRDDWDLMNLFDEKLRASEHKWDVRDSRAPSAVTQLYAITMRKAGTFYTVVRDDTAVTVLDEEMVKNNFAGQWEPILNLPFQGLRGIELPPTPAPRSIEDEAIAKLAVVKLRRDAARSALVAAERELEAAELALDNAIADVVGPAKASTDLVRPKGM